MLQMNRSEPTGAGTPLWDGGWYRFAALLASPNCDARPAATVVGLIVLHSISLPPGEFGGDQVQRLFTNQLDWDQHPYFRSIQGLRVSSHFFIRRQGELWQFVSADERAWHAGASSYLGTSHCNDFSIGIELEGIEGGHFEDSQYETLATLCAALAQRFPVSAIVGHEHVAPARKTDPGRGFDWQRLQQTLGWPAACFPAPAR